MLGDGLMREVPDAVGRSDSGGRYDAGLGPDDWGNI